LKTEERRHYNFKCCI